MSILPNHRPQKLSLGPLEAEILNLVWNLGSATVKEIHEEILSDPDRELSYPTVTTVLNRLTQKGWLVCHRQDRAFTWEPLISREEAKAIQSYDKLQNFLAISNPDLVASFADSLDTASLEQLQAITARLQAIRHQRKEG